jgi:hypothetical protein
MLELGGTVGADERSGPWESDLGRWEEEARRREEEEVEWYEGLLSEETDGATRDLLGEILDSERHHARELGGKWMPAS